MLEISLESISSVIDFVIPGPPLSHDGNMSQVEHFVMDFVTRGLYQLHARNMPGSVGGSDGLPGSVGLAGSGGYMHADMLTCIHAHTHAHSHTCTHAPASISVSTFLDP